METKKNKGFIMAFTIIIVFLSMLVFLGIYNLFSADIAIISYQKNNIQNFFSYSNNQATISKAYKTMNNDGGNIDNLSCSGGVISCYEGKNPMCSSDDWVAVPDGISDTCDNDDGGPNYSNGNIGNLISSDSKTEDNDAYINKNNPGFLLPGETRTVFIFNEEIKNYFILNSSLYNIVPNTSYDKIFIHGEFSFTGGIAQLYVLKRGDSSQLPIFEKTGVIRTQTGFYDNEGNFDSVAIPYMNDGEIYDIVLNITNNSTDILNYNIHATNSNTPLYFIPIIQKDNIIRLQFPQYRSKNRILSKKIFPD